MQSTRPSGFNTGPNPNRRGRGGFNNSNNSRNQPYVKSAGFPHSTPPAGKWQHDKNELFHASSSLYNPTLGTDFQVGISSASLRPFGTATPLPYQPVLSPAAIISRPIPAPAAYLQPPPTKPASSSSQTIFGRFDIKGKSHEESEKRKQNEVNRAAREEEKRIQRVRVEDERMRKEFEAQFKRENAKLMEMIEYEERGFVVEVAGLVYGTSADDVQTAFGQYGATLNCVIVNAESAQEGDDLVARLVFERYLDADTAVNKLNGAIADGKPLRVKRGEKTVMPTLPTFISPSSRKNSRYQPSVSIAPVVVETPFIPVPGARTMYADEVQAYDPRVQSVSSVPVIPETSMDIDMDVEMDHDATAVIPTGPRSGRGSSRGGRGGGRGGRNGSGSTNGGGQKSVQSETTPTLLDRLGKGTTSKPAGGANGMKSLLDRFK